MQTYDEPHDVFLSYAREDYQWVRDHLYEPLRRTRTTSGRPPRIFFDLGEDGIQVGQDFKTAIDRAIEKVNKFVPVYSSRYFQKDMCVYELELAQSRDMNFRHQLLLPILVDPTAAGKVPFAFRRLNYLTIQDPDWLAKLCRSLQLQSTAENISLAFLDQPGDVFANHTLPVVRVAVHADGQPIAYEEEVTLAAETGQLLGTTTVKTEQGLAKFDDLSIAEAVGETRLVASSVTAGQAISADFRVYPRPSRQQVSIEPRAASLRTTIPKTGEVVFFDNSEHLALLQPEEVHIYGADGAPVASHTLRAPVRLIRRQGEYVALGDWKGNIYLLHQDGNCRVWEFGANAQGFVVPADIDFLGDDIYVAFWSGSVFQLSPSGHAEIRQKDAAGVQAIGVFGDRLFVSDFAGNLRIYRNRRLVNAASLEPTIWLLVATPTCLVAVGDHRFYHISPDGTRVMGFDMPLDDVIAVLELSELPVVTDARGKGIRFDENLAISATVSVQPGAEPMSADNAGKYCVFRNPDQTQTLLLRDRIIFSHREGCLSVSPEGNRFALGDETQVEIYTEAELQQLVREADASMHDAQGQRGDTAG